jgi:hypothetical protein
MRTKLDIYVYIIVVFFVLFLNFVNEDKPNNLKFWEQ